jgi:hypothetical protein
MQGVQGAVCVLSDPSSCSDVPEQGEMSAVLCSALLRGHLSCRHICLAPLLPVVAAYRH